MITLNSANVAIVILNYNNALDTENCLKSLSALVTRPRNILVVDNGSEDGSAKRLTAFISRESITASLIPLDDNNGYSAGNNAGIRLALSDPSCQAVWILNNDTEVDPNALEALCVRMNERPDVGLAGSTMVLAHDRTIVQCAAGFGFNKCWGTTPACHGGESFADVRSLGPALVERKLGYLCGASILARREVFEAAGFLPEEYFLYYEDAAFCLNVQKAGYSLAWAPESIVFHKEGGSTGAKSEAADRGLKRSRFVDYLALRNRIYLVRKYFPCCLPIVVASYAGVMLNRLRRGQGGRLPLVLKALADGIRGRMGKPDTFFPAVKSHRILFLTVRADFGGGPEHLWRLLQAVPEGVTAYVACPEEYPYYERFREIVGDSNIIELPHRTFSMARFWSLRAFCTEQNISVLHSHGKGAGLYSRLLALLTGLPCVHTFHGVHMDGYLPQKRIVYRLYERVMSLFTHTGIAVSEGELNQIVERGLMPREKLRLIPNGVMIPDANSAKGGFVPSPPYTVVIFSRFDYQKNSPFLLDILHVLKDLGRLADFRLTAVGDGADRQAMLDATQGTALKDALCCPGASETPHSFFDGALCYLSTSRWEGMPLSLIEAMAHGLPVVASDVVGNSDVVRDGETGFLYPEGNASAAANFLCRLADEPNLRQTLGEAARNYVIANHDVRIMAKETFKILHDVACHKVE